MPVLRSILVISLLAGLLWSAQARAHGSVAAEDDLCLIEIGFYRAHFKIYLPREHQHEQFCEDLPVAGESVFVMEYIHSGLSEVPIDFRIIENVTGQGRYARLSDVQQIGDLEAVTVYHHAARTQPDVFTVRHEFEAPGSFIGIVTIDRPEAGRVYTAVFPFEVGFTGIGWWPWFVVAAIALHLCYVWMGRRA